MGVVLMISSGEAIEEFAQSKAESNLTALIDAAPRTAHVVVLPGMRGHVHASGSEHTADVTADGFRTVRVSDSGETDNQDGEKRAFASESPETDTKGASQTYDAAGERFETVPVDQVQLGDVILVLPGETVPVDGELLSGVATLDLSNINGEPVPREVYARSRDVRCGQWLHNIDHARHATCARFAIPEDPGAGLVGARVAPRCREDRGYACSAVYRAFACDCWDCMGDFRIAAAICASIGACYAVSAVDCRAGRICGWNRATCQSGNPDQAQDVLENLGRVSHIFFDKTGTLTVKQPQVVRVEKPFETSSPFNEDHILMMASVVEGYSVHILSKGIAAAGRKAMDDLYARYAAGQRLCVERDLPGHGRDYPVVKNIVEESGKYIRRSERASGARGAVRIRDG